MENTEYSSLVCLVDEHKISAIKMCRQKHNKNWDKMVLYIYFLTTLVFHMLVNDQLYKSFVRGELNLITTGLPTSYTLS